MDHYVMTRALHFIGLVLWMGGTIAVALLAARAGNREASLASRSVLRGLATPAMVLTWLGGLGMLMPQWSAAYSHQGWMHAKLALVLVASGLSGAAAGMLKRAEQGEGNEVPYGKIRGMAFGLVAILVIVVGLAVAKPGA